MALETSIQNEFKRALFAAAATRSRRFAELSGLMFIDPRSDALGAQDEIDVPNPIDLTVEAFSEKVNLPDDPSQETRGMTTVKLDAGIIVRQPYSKEQRLALTNSGVGNSVLEQDMAGMMDQLAQNIETKVVNAIRTNTTRAVGMTNTPAIGSTLGAYKDAGTVLDENSVPTQRRVLVMDPASYNSLILTDAGKAYIIGTASGLTEGRISTINGFDSLRTSANLVHTNADRVTGTTTVNNSAGYPVGATQIAMDGAGFGGKTPRAGDTFTFANDTNNYVLKSFAGGVATINKPGLRKAVADNAAITWNGDYKALIATQPNAVIGVMRAPAGFLPQYANPMKVTEVVVDPVSGLSFGARYVEGQLDVDYVEMAVKAGFVVRMPWYTGLVYDQK